MTSILNFNTCINDYHIWFHSCLNKCIFFPNIGDNATVWKDARSQCGFLTLQKLIRTINHTHVTILQDSVGNGKFTNHLDDLEDLNVIYQVINIKAYHCQTLFKILVFMLVKSSSYSSVISITILHHVTRNLNVHY